MISRGSFAAMAAAFVLNIGAAAQAQTGPTVQTATCMLGGVSFTTGAIAAAGSGIKQCGADGTWIDATGEAFGCIYASQSYAVGSIVAVEGADVLTMQCLKEGIWKKQ